MVVQGNREGQNALLYFMDGECRIAQNHVDILLIPDATVVPIINVETIVLGDYSAHIGSLRTETDGTELIALREGEWALVNTKYGSVSQLYGSNKPYTLSWEIVRPDLNGNFETLYRFKARKEDA